MACQASPGRAGTTLASLIQHGGTVTSGKEVFSNFAYTTGGGMPPASQITVVPITIGGVSGIEIQGSFQSTGSVSDALISFVVTSTGADITGASMSGNPSVTGNPSLGALTVTETFLPQQSTAKLGIFDIEPGSSIQTSDSLKFATAVHKLNVQKDIIAFGEAGSTAGITTIDQLFPQVTPEPSSLALLGIGVLATLGYRRWRAQ